MLEPCCNCKRLFNNLQDDNFCPECMIKMELKIKKINEYIRQHQDITAEELSKEFAVSKDVIRRIQKNKLISKTGCCQQCGKSVDIGIFCGECKSQTGKELKLYRIEKREIQTEPKAKMHFVRRA